LKAGMDVNKKDKYGASLFDLAIAVDDVSAVKLMVNKADVNQVDNAGDNSLHVAALRGDPIVISLIMKKKLILIAKTIWASRHYIMRVKMVI
jgi:ankyrin repeat protein